MRRLNHNLEANRAVALSHFLTSNGVKNELELSKNEDWGSENYGGNDCLIWVVNEGDIERAKELTQQFLENPPKQIDHQILLEKKPPAPKAKKNESLFGMLSTLIIALCVVIFAICEWTVPAHPDEVANPIAAVPLTSAPLKQTLLYDWPLPYQLVDEIYTLYGPEVFRDPSSLPPRGVELWNRAVTTPMWEGIYPVLVSFARGDKLPKSAEAELFTKIGEGEIWRSFTPALLHFDIFHLFFNMIWLAFLGRQIEKKIGIFRYLLLILAAGIISNSCQYLMSGPNFLGYSGVLTAYFGFIWMRQRIAPFEGYQVQPALFTFMGIFILGLALLQAISFATEILFNFPISPGIANTAHVSGVVIGLLLGRLSLFAWKPVNNQ